MNRAECRNYAINLYHVATKKHDVDDQQWNLVLDTFNKKYWSDAAKGIGSMLAIDSPDVSTDVNGAFDLTKGASANIDSEGVHLPLAVECKFQGRYIRLDYEVPQDRYMYNIAFGQVQALIPSAWTLVGEKINLLPRVNAAQVLRVVYVPRVGDWVNDSTNALRGFLPDWHHLLSYEAATMMAPDSTWLARMTSELRSQWNTFVQSRQRQEGRKIRFVPYE